MVLSMNIKLISTLKTPLNDKPYRPICWVIYGVHISSDIAISTISRIFKTILE